MTLRCSTRRSKGKFIDLSKLLIFDFTFKRLNIDQRHFPMLREYEKAKLQMMNNDLGEESARNTITTGGMNKTSPYQNFMRSTNGKKLYYNDAEMPPTRIFENTKQNMTRQRILYRAHNGLPLAKVTQNKEFIPANRMEAKKAIKATNIGLYDDEYDLKKEHDFFVHQEAKSKCLYGDFKKSYHHDNGKEVDEFGILKNVKKMKRNAQSLQAIPDDQSTKSQSLASNNKSSRMRNTNAKFENSMNAYQTFLNDKSELPRLSILDNYKQIMRIMTNSYMKGTEYQNKFKNRMEKDIINDEEYQKFKEEETNTKKMSTILKSLNVPFRKSQNGKLGGTVTETQKGKMKRYQSSNQDSSASNKFVGDQTYSQKSKEKF